jgi:hypothetical protein
VITESILGDAQASDETEIELVRPDRKKEWIVLVKGGGGSLGRHFTPVMNSHESS